MPSAKEIEMADSADVEEAGSPTVRGRTSSVGSNGSRRNSFTKLASDEDVKLEVTSTVEATVVKPASRRPGFFRRFIRDMAEGLDAAISLFEDEPVAPTVKLDPTLDGPKMEALRKSIMARRAAAAAKPHVIEVQPTAVSVK